jgi:hypothetical protein
MRAIRRHRRPEGRACLGGRTIRHRATEAFRLHYPVGRAVLTIANHAVNASESWPLGTCPGAFVCGLVVDRRGAMRDADQVPCSFAG